MSDPKTRRPSGEEQIDESGRNPTQRRLDEEGREGKPADARWPDEEEEESERERSRYETIEDEE
jgi:hypothetical protein